MLFVQFYEQSQRLVTNHSFVCVLECQSHRKFDLLDFQKWRFLGCHWSRADKAFWEKESGCLWHLISVFLCIFRLTRFAICGCISSNQQRKAQRVTRWQRQRDAEKDSTISNTRVCLPTWNTPDSWEYLLNFPLKQPSMFLNVHCSWSNLAWMFHPSD